MLDYPLVEKNLSKEKNTDAVTTTITTTVAAPGTAVFTARELAEDIMVSLMECLTLPAYIFVRPGHLGELALWVHFPIDTQMVQAPPQ